MRLGPVARRWILLALVLLLPVLVWRGANDQLNVPKLGLLMFGVCLVAGIRIVEVLQGAPHDGLRRLVFPAAVIVVPLLIGWAFSPYRSYALFGFYSRWQGLIPYVAIALFGILLADAFGGRAREIAWALVLSAAVVGAYAVVQRAGLDPLDWFRPGGDPNEAVTTLGNPNFTGGFLGIVTPVALGLMLTEATRKTYATILLTLVVVGLVVSFSQGGWGAAIAGSALVLGLTYRTRWRHSVKAAVAVTVLMATVAIGLVAVSAIAPAASFVPGTAFIRGEAWRAAVSMAADHPLVGRGPNVFAIEGAQHRSAFNGTRAGYNFPDDPHSVFLALTTSAGLLGAVGFVLFLWWIAQHVRRSGVPPGMGAAFLGAITAYVIQSLVSIDEVALRTTMWTCLAAFVAAGLGRDSDVLAVLSKKERARARTESLRKPIAAALLAAIALAGAWWSMNFVIADSRVWQGQLLAAAGAPAAAGNEFALARGFRDDYQYRVVEGEFLSRAAVASEEPDRDAFEDALTSFDFLDDFPHILYLLKEAEALDNGTAFDSSFDERALETYERMQRIDPKNPMIRAGAADSLVELGRASEAIESLEPYVDDVDPIRRPQFFAVLALAYAAEGDVESTRDTLARLDDQGARLPHAVRALEIIEGQG